MLLQLGDIYYRTHDEPINGEFGVATNGSLTGRELSDDEVEAAIVGDVSIGEHGYSFLVHATDGGGDCIEGEYEAAVLLLEDLSGLRWDAAGIVHEGGQAVEPTIVGELHVIAQADEWRVEADDDDQVHLIDGEGTVRASMPLEIWDGLVKSSSY